MNTDAISQLPQYLRLLLLLDSCTMLESRKRSGLLGIKIDNCNSKCRLLDFISLFLGCACLVVLYLSALSVFLRLQKVLYFPLALLLQCLSS
jgi:hypothetical protein